MYMLSYIANIYSVHSIKCSLQDTSREQYIAFSGEVTAAILLFQNNEMPTMFVYQTNPVGAELFSYVKT